MNRTLSVEHIEKLNESGYNDIVTAIGTDPVRVGDIAAALLRNAFAAFPALGYMLLSSGILYLMWHDQRSLTGPTIFLMLFGALLFTFIPEAYALYLQLAALLGLTAVLVKMYRDGRQ